MRCVALHTHTGTVKLVINRHSVLFELRPVTLRCLHM